MNDVKNKEVYNNQENIIDDEVSEETKQWIASETWMTVPEFVKLLKSEIRKELEDAGYE